MKSIIFVTGNPQKIVHAQHDLGFFEIEVEHVNLDLDEIQSDDFEKIAVHKAKQAFELIKKPLFINDAGWLIPALNGFPGPYMKYMNKWFKPEDFIALMQGKENREIILRDTITYIDEDGIKTFSGDHVGKILEAPIGDNGVVSDSVVSTTSDGRSIAERHGAPDPGKQTEVKIWKEFCEWLANK